MIIVIATILAFVLTSIMSMVGIGIAFIMIPILMTLGIEIHAAMATALLLNTFANCISSYTYVRLKLVEWQLAFPIMIVAVLLSPVGVMLSQQLDRATLLSLFSCFLVFAGLMMIFYSPRHKEQELGRRTQIVRGSIIGGAAGFIGGLLGIGGGSIIVPSLIGTGMEPKRASGTSSFIIIFASFTGFVAHVSMSDIDMTLAICVTLAAGAGAKLGSWFMTERMQNTQLKKLVGVILLCTAMKVIWDVISPLVSF